MTKWLPQLCSYLGVHAQYRGYEGQMVHISPETQSAVLGAMGLDVDSEAAAGDLLSQLKAEDAARPSPSEVIVNAGKKETITLTHASDWQLLADGTDVEIASGQADKIIFLPALPLGIHQLHLTAKTGDFTTWVLARPHRAVQLEDQLPTGRIWGVLAALYGLTDGAATRIGSYGMLGDYAAAMAGHGADFLGINPVHAMGQTRPDDVISPYSPSHRGFLNTWHCNDFSGPMGGADTLLDYPTALRTNEHALSDQFAQFNALPDRAPQRLAFQSFTTEAGAPLHDFAVFEAMSARLGADWREWPTKYRTHDPKTRAAFEAKFDTEITRTKWAQWQADVQLSQAQSTAKNAGMGLGLYLDLAVGPRLGGAETWAKDTALITGATLGAPPDPLGPLGQSWGLAPQSPLKCRTEGYASFARLIRTAMRHAGMIRIDHVLGLMRSFWIPEGGTEGAYVSYPFEALLAVVAIESVRNNTVVVGEDLGLVPEGLREELAARGIYGLDVLQYMRTPTGGFVDTAKTRRQAICGFATHDTPTVAGFFAAEDARARHEFGDIDADTLAQTRADRMRAQETLNATDPVDEIHLQLAQANASMVAIQLDDIAKRTSQQNLPGTIDSYPNWRLKAALTIEEITNSDAFVRLANTMRSQNRAIAIGMEKEDDLQDCSNRVH